MTTQDVSVNITVKVDEGEKSPAADTKTTTTIVTTTAPGLTPTTPEDGCPEELGMAGELQERSHSGTDVEEVIAVEAPDQIPVLPYTPALAEFIADMSLEGGVTASLLSETPLDGVLPLAGVKRRGSTNSESGCSEMGSSVVSTESNWLPIPEAICVYHQRGSCLRLNCRFFHGSAEQLKDLRETGCSHYRFDQANAVEVPKEGDELPETTAADEPALGIRFSEESSRGKRKKPIVCLAFLSGTCRRSDCRFTHLPPTVRPLPATACAYFAVGTCKRNSCRYFHGTEEELAKLKSQGATMYNPTTNEPYEKIPDFDEPVTVRRPEINSAGSSLHGGGSPGGQQVNGGNSSVNSQGITFQGSHSQPPPYLNMQAGQGGVQPPVHMVQSGTVPLNTQQQPQPQPQIIMLPAGAAGQPVGSILPQPQFQPTPQPQYQQVVPQQPQYQQQQQPQMVQMGTPPAMQLPGGPPTMIPQIGPQGVPGYPQPQPQPGGYLPQPMAAPQPLQYQQAPVPAPGVPQQVTYMQTPQGLVPVAMGQQHQQQMAPLPGVMQMPPQQYAAAPGQQQVPMVMQQQAPSALMQQQPIAQYQQIGQPQQFVQHPMQPVAQQPGVPGVDPKMMMMTNGAMRSQ